MWKDKIEAAFPIDGASWDIAITHIAQRKAATWALREVARMITAEASSENYAMVSLVNLTKVGTQILLELGEG